MHQFGTRRNDVIGLHFAGDKVVMVKRFLLVQFEGSMLASIFSGLYEEQLDRDQHGNVFFD